MLNGANGVEGEAAATFRTGVSPGKAVRSLLVRAGGRMVGSKDESGPTASGGTAGPRASVGETGTCSCCDIFSLGSFIPSTDLY